MITFDHESMLEVPDGEYGEEFLAIQAEGDEDYWAYWLDMNDMTDEEAENYFDSLIDID